MEEEYLAAPCEFVVDYALNLFFIEEDDLRLGWNPIWRRCVYDGRSLAPSNENWRVLGIGVAVRVRVSTDDLI